MCSCKLLLFESETFILRCKTRTIRLGRWLNGKSSCCSSMRTRVQISSYSSSIELDVGEHVCNPSVGRWRHVGSGDLLPCVYPKWWGSLKYLRKTTSQPLAFTPTCMSTPHKHVNTHTYYTHTKAYHTHTHTYINCWSWNSREGKIQIQDCPS